MSNVIKGAKMSAAETWHVKFYGNSDSNPADDNRHDATLDQIWQAVRRCAAAMDGAYDLNITITAEPARLPCEDGEP